MYRAPSPAGCRSTVSRSRSPRAGRRRSWDFRLPNAQPSDVSFRAWTGHNPDWATQTYRFYSSQHDTGNKTFFGQTKNWDGPDIVNEILRDNAEKKAVAARFITRKLWEFLAYSSPANSLVDELAAVFLAADLEPVDRLRLHVADGCLLFLCLGEPVFDA